MDAAQLVSAAEIAQRLGLRRPQNVHAWRYRDDRFPKPLVSLGTGARRVHVWYWPDVERWLEIRRPPGRPRKQAALADPVGRREVDHGHRGTPEP